LAPWKTKTERLFFWQFYLEAFPKLKYFIGEDIVQQVTSIWSIHL